MPEWSATDVPVRSPHSTANANTSKHSKARRSWPFLDGPVVQAALTHNCGADSEKSQAREAQASRRERLLVGLNA